MESYMSISLCDPVLGDEEKQALGSVIDSLWLTMGERVASFERSFADLHRMESAVAVNSCTAGLHLCLEAFNIGPGDEVLVPSLTFVATVNAVLYVGATPVFVDIEKEEIPHISLTDAQAKCTYKTRAVIVMHYGGYIVDLQKWRTFADANKLILIEDAAHAPAMKDVGQLSDAAAFSFFTNKNMTTAEGGMVLSPDTKILERIRRLRSHGMTTVTLDRYYGHAYSYDVTMLGYNYRMDELRASIGLVQLNHLRQWNEQRYKLSHTYRQILSSHIPEVVVPFDKDHETAAHLMPILLPTNVDRKELMVYLRESGIQSSIHYPAIHHFTFYRKKFPGIVLPETENFCSRELTLPLHPSLTENDVENIVESLKKEMNRSLI
jgi:dTDP-4-amino-4,6-dideoxygalactose transaminase